MKHKVKFKEWSCIVEFARYPRQFGGRLAMVLKEERTGAPVVTCTVNIPEWQGASDEVLIKNWSENEGVLYALVEAKVLLPTGGRVRVGFVSASVCRLLIPVPAGV